MSIGTVLISTEAAPHARHHAVHARMATTPGPCFIGCAVGDVSVGAAALRIAGGIFTKIPPTSTPDLMKIVFNIKEDDARNPGVIADCTGDNAGDSVGPTADEVRDLRRHRRRAHHVHPRRVPAPRRRPRRLPPRRGHRDGVHYSAPDDIGKWVQTVLLVWIFALRIVMVLASILSYLINEAVTKCSKYA